MKRRTGSVKFDPYYKVQWFDPVVCAWRDIQRSYETPESCREAMTVDRTWRIMEVTTDGRRPYALT